MRKRMSHPHTRLVAVVSLLFACFGIAGVVHADDRPNILFAIADDWGWPHASAYGDAVVKTPNFDRLAKEGVLFPSCVRVVAVVYCRREGRF